MRRPLFPLIALAPAQVQGSGALTTRGPGWSGDGIAMAAYDEPAIPGVTLPTGVASPPPVTLRRPPVSLRRPWSLRRPRL
jgi:hypothetical protein